MEALQGVSNPNYTEKDINCTPSANKVISTAEPRCSHAVCTLQVHPPTSSPCPALFEAQPISKDFSRSGIMTLLGTMGPKHVWVITRVNSSICEEEI